MAVVAIHAVVDVTANTLVSSVGVRLGMAVRALENAVVTGIGMAGGAHPIRPAVIGRKPSVIEGCIQPAAGRVTSDAGRGKSR